MAGDWRMQLLMVKAKSCFKLTPLSSSNYNNWLEYKAEAVRLRLVRRQSMDVEIDRYLHLSARLVLLAHLSLVLYQIRADKLL